MQKLNLEKDEEKQKTAAQLHDASIGNEDIA